MQILLASAKIMKERCRSVGTAPHSPLFQKQALALAEDLSHYTAVELSQMFSCSPAIGEQNHRRKESFRVLETSSHGYTYRIRED